MCWLKRVNSHHFFLTQKISFALFRSLFLSFVNTLGAREVYACATHAVFSPPAVERLGSGAFTEVIVTNSIPHTPERDFAQLTVLSVGNLLGETIWRVHNDTPVSFNKL